MKFDTKVVHFGQVTDETTGAIVFPIYQTSTYKQLEPGITKGYSYSRTENPTRDALERCLAELENGKYALAFSSGMAAISAVLNLLQKNDHIIANSVIYGGTYRIFTKVYSKFGFEFSFVDTSSLNNITPAIKNNTKMLWLETPTNPLLDITDIKEAVLIVKNKGILTVVDNTFATPYLQKPLEYGADIVVHSTTKYINGHGDVVGGAIITNSKELYESLKFLQNAVGAIPSPFDCFLTLRGIQTFSLRMERHCYNARKIAQFLTNHKKVKKVYYPGLTTHKGYNIAAKQMKDFGGMLSFVLDADGITTKKFTTYTKIFTLAESLGIVKSLICHPATMTHASMEPHIREQLGITDNLIRLSVGIEDAEDLIEDLKQALEKI